MNQLLIPHNFFTWSVFNSCIIYVLIKPHGSRCWSSGQHGSLTTMRLGVRFTSLWDREVLIFQQQQTQWIESRSAFVLYSELHCVLLKNVLIATSPIKLVANSIVVPGLKINKQYLDGNSRCCWQKHSWPSLRKHVSQADGLQNSFKAYRL